MMGSVIDWKFLKNIAFKKILFSFTTCPVKNQGYMIVVILGRSPIDFVLKRCNGLEYQDLNPS